MNKHRLDACLVAQATIESPLGPLLLAATPRGLAGAWFTDQAHHPGPLSAPELPGNDFIAQARRELGSSWQDAAGTRFTVELDPQGTAFQRAVWDALLAIPAGTTGTYAGLARSLGQATALRAVGAAVGRNPLSIIVPCHRVLGSDGSLTGYAGGLHRKRDLLAREGRPTARAPRVVTPSPEAVPA